MATIFKPSGPKGQALRPTTPPQEELSLTILRLADDGRGIAQHNNKVVFVSGVLPGERIKARWLRRHKRFDEAECVQRESNSAQRATPICDVYEHCGGCQLQHLAYSEQLEHKRKRLTALLKSGIEVDCIQGASSGYRHRARLSYRAGHLGFNAAASHHIIDMELCPVLESQLERAIIAARPVLLKALKQSHRAELHFSLGEDGRVGLAIEDDRRRDNTWCQTLTRHLPSEVVLYQVDSPAGQWLGELTPLTYSEAPQAVAFTPADFTQANRSLNRELVERSVEWLAAMPGERIIDYFCGLGNFSLPLASTGAQVLAVDSGESMLQRARQRAEALDLNIEFARADLFEPEQVPVRKATAALLDPPRAGARAVCQAIAAAPQLRRLVYVSCDPATLARDARILTDSGFVLKKATMADMFPHTHHMESLVLLER